MVHLSHQNAQCPPGGSHFAHSFQRRQAYEGYVHHVREREIINKERYQTQVLGKSKSIDPERWKACFGKGRSCIPGEAAAGSVLGSKFDTLPNLTPKQEKEIEKQKSEPLLKFGWQDTFKDPHFIVPGNNKTSYKPQWHYLEPKDLVKPPDLSTTKVRPQWFPKNNLDINLPRVNLYRIDPIYYDDPPKFEMRNNYGSHQAPPVEVPFQAEKWKSQEGWSNPVNRGVFKITEKVLVENRSK